MPERGTMAGMNDRDVRPEISCTTCEACCCKLEVLLMGADDIPGTLTIQDQWGGWVMLRLQDGWCAALDRHTLRCTIYEHRPFLCREYEMGGSECIGERLQYFGHQPHGQTGLTT